jgi:glycosyltransferase involved in cell wall biosynthesis
MKKIILAPNGYDEEKFTGKLSKAESRMYVGLPSESTIVMYTGSLYTWKGVDVLVEVAKKLPQHTFVLVGGAAEEHRVLRGTTPPNNVLFIEHQSPDVIPFYLASADVLVLPNVPTTQHSTYSTSPIKLFEYMASRRLVVASRLPSITSLVSEDEVVFAEPGDVEDWGNKLNEVLRQPELFAHKVEQAMRLVQQYSWDNRAKKIIRMVYS